MLRTGGEECDMQVEAVIFQGGRRWMLPENKGGKVQNFIRHIFPQVYPEP